MFFRTKAPITIFIILNVNLCLSAQKTDKVFLLNGNVITCEIMELEVGKLDCKTDDIGRIKIEWDAIDSLWSDKQFEIHLRDGTIVYTTLDSSFYEFGNYEFTDMIELAQIKNKFWKRIDGNIDLGFNYSKSSQILQLNLDSKIFYRFYRSEFNLTLSTMLTEDQNESRTNKKDYNLQYKRYFNRRYFSSATAGFDQNSELGIKARYYVAGGLGKNLIYTPSALLDPGIGFLLNEEFSTEANTSGRTNFEMVGTIEFNKFSYNDPELDIFADATIYTSLNDLGRIRGEFSTSARIEVINDFYIKLTFYYSFDTKPVDENASQNDWGTTLTLSYSF